MQRDYHTAFISFPKQNKNRMAHTLWIIRHGDRFDFNIGKEEWRKVAQRLNDPPLSDLGMQQVGELGNFFKSMACKASETNKSAISRIITSPFLRCIQTSNPIAGALGLPIQIDHSLWEVIWTNENMPTLEERAAYFPRIDLTYTSIFRPEVDEEYPTGAMERFGETAKTITEKFAGESCVLVTHAAGVVAIVASLLKCRICDIKPASPCCLYRLDRESVTSPWTLSSEFDGTTSHLSELGVTNKWPDPLNESDEFGLKFIHAGNSPSWVSN